MKKLLAIITSLCLINVICVVLLYVVKFAAAGLAIGFGLFIVMKLFGLL